MPQRTKSSTKLDSSQSEAALYRRTKRLRIDSDEGEDEGYEPRLERHTPYTESYTRGGAEVPSPQGPGGLMNKRQNRDSEHGEDSDSELRMKDHHDQRDEEGEADSRSPYQEDNYDAFETSSPLTVTSYRDSSPPAEPAATRPTSASTSLNNHVPSTGGRVRKMSTKAKQLAATQATTTVIPTKKSTAKGKQKAPSSDANKRKRKQDVESEDEEEYYNYENDGVNGDEEDGEEEARFSDDYDDYEEERPANRKKGRRGVSAGAGVGGRGNRTREKEKERDMTSLEKVKFEGKPPAVSPTMATTKRLRAKRTLTEDAVEGDMEDSGTPELSIMGSPTAATATDGNKEDTSAGLVPPAKKRKLPTIKKLKGTTNLGGAGVDASGSAGTGPSTPSTGVVAGTKPPALAPQPGAVASNGVNKLGIVEGSKAGRPKTNATSDLDLSNPSLYAELFKNPGGGASRTGLNRRAKEEERRKELDKMRDEYKARFADGMKSSFDLQGQAEKMARFEEVLRHRHSSALYPNFLAAKWREEWEKEKRRVNQREHQQQVQLNGRVDNTKEEGEM